MLHLIERPVPVRKLKRPVHELASVREIEDFHKRVRNIANFVSKRDSDCIREALVQLMGIMNPTRTTEWGVSFKHGPITRHGEIMMLYLLKDARCS
jgi:hypothetical protein